MNPASAGSPKGRDAEGGSIREADDIAVGEADAPNTVASPSIAGMSDSDWIEWNGGECPVDPETIVDVRYRDGEVERTLRARRLCFKTGDWWKHEGEPTYNLDTDEEGVCHACDVVAYRIVRTALQGESK